MDNVNATVLVVIIVIILLEYCSCVAILRRHNIGCNKLSTSELSNVLGGAFNSRYMSIGTPPSTEANEQKGSLKRSRAFDTQFESFYVDDSYQQQIGEEPAWPPRNKRALKTTREWDCQSKVVWKDLGPDYFPRYLRCVECHNKTCWYNLFKCKPKSFTVKLLRRRQDLCVITETEMDVQLGTEGLPIDLRDFWLWEERAVTFCCDCAL